MPNEKPDSFQCGPFEVARNPDVRSFVEKLNRLREAVDQCRVQPGVGYTVNRSSGGTVLAIKTGSASGEAEFVHPFKLRVRPQGSRFQFLCTTGTVGDNDPRVDNLETWVDFEAPARIYLEAVIEDLAITSLTLKAQKADDPLARTVVEDGKQTQARISIGLYVATEPGKTDYRIIQNVTTNIMTPLFCFSGYPALALTQEFVNAYYS